MLRFKHVLQNTYGIMSIQRCLDSKLYNSNQARSKVHICLHIVNEGNILWCYNLL